MGVRDVIAAGYTKTKGAMGKGLRGAGWTTAIVGGVAALGMWASSSRRNAHRRAEEDIRNADLRQDMPQVMPPQMVPARQPDMVGPAEGRAENEWQNRVAAQRGLAPQVQQAVNPQMNVVPESSVQDLGAPPTPTR